MFLGTFRHVLDSKNRITLPAKYRERLADGIVLTTGRDRFLLVFPTAEFAQVQKRLNELSLTGRDASTLRRLFYSNASDLKPDKMGRVIVPEELKEYAGIGSEVVIVGAGQFMEIWSPDEWKHALEEVKEHAAQDAVWANLGI